MRDIIFPCGLWNNTCPFTVSFPIPLPITLRILSHLAFLLPILGSLPLSSPILTALRILLTLTVVNVIAIARTAPFTARCSGNHPVLILNLLVYYLIPTRWSKGQEVAWLVLMADWRLNLCPDIIANGLRKMLAGAFNHHQAGCLLVGAIDLIPEAAGVVPPPIVHLVTGVVKHLPYQCAERCPPLPTMWTSAPAVRQHQLELWTVASCDWIKKHYIINEVPCPFILAAANIVYPYASTNVFRNESLYILLIQWHLSTYNRCCHFCHSSCLPRSFAEALWCHSSQWKLNLHQRCYHYDTVECGGSKSGGNVQSCIGYQVFLAMRGVVLFKSCDVEICLDSGGVLNTEWKQNGAVGGKKGYIYLSFWEFLVQLVRYENFGSYPALCWLMNTKWPSLHLAHPQGTSWIRNIEIRFGTPGEESFLCQALCLQCISCLVLRPHASWSKLSGSPVVPTMETFKMPTNMPSSGRCKCKCDRRIETTSLFNLRCFLLCHREISTRKLKIFTIDSSKYCAKNKCNTMIVLPSRYKHPPSGANRPSDVAVTVNIDAEFNLSSFWCQLIPSLNAIQGISSTGILKVCSLARSTLRLTLLSRPSLVTHIGVYLSCCCICMHRKLFKHS